MRRGESPSPGTPGRPRSTWKKHGVTFEAACEAFFDPFLQAVPGQEIDGEFREAVLGFTPSWRLLHVAFVFRRDRIRLVSARLATSFERKRYEDDPAS
jgi:hypothetical protein